MNRAVLVAPALAILALSACVRMPDSAGASSPSTLPGVTLRAERDGERVVLTLGNRSDRVVGYNLCTSALMRSSGAGWTDVPTGVVCTMELRTLQPGRSDEFPHRLPSGLSPGEYRYQTGIESPLGGERHSVTSNSFRLP